MKKAILSLGIFVFGATLYAQTPINSLPIQMVHSNTAKVNLDAGGSSEGGDLIVQSNNGKGRTQIKVVPSGTDKRASVLVQNSADQANTGAAVLSVEQNYAVLSATNVGAPNIPIQNVAVELDPNNQQSGEAFQVTTGAAAASPNATVLLHVAGNGNVGVGTTDPKETLSVDGMVLANEVKVVNDIQVPDYVFSDNYDLRPLAEVEAYIEANHHLPEIPSAAEVSEKGLLMSEMTLGLLKKVEELTLYTIDLQKANTELLKRIEALEQAIEK